ncbi:MAG: nitrilase [Clostridia bacterium]|nr:nitrilase [Clostridia bacterium]
MTARALKGALAVLARLAAWRGRAEAARREARRLLATLGEPLAREAEERRGRYLAWRAGGEGGGRRATIRVAAVQMELRPEPSPRAFARHVFSLLRKAAECGAELVAFPEDAATGLVALLPGFALLSRPGTATGGPAARGLPVAEVFRLLGAAVGATYRAVFATFAEGFGLFLVAGTANLPEPDGRVQNVAHVFAPDGRLLARQPKLHLFPYEAAWGIAPGSDLLAFPTPWGPMASPVCMDATYFETARIARALGAEVVILPIADPGPAHLWKGRRGLWARCQEGGFYGVQSALVGRFLGLALSGRSAVFAPLELSPRGDGVLAEADDPASETVVWADLDLEALRSWRAEQPDVRAPGFWRRLADGSIWRGRGRAT